MERKHTRRQGARNILVPFGTITVPRKTTAQNRPSKHPSINHDGTLRKATPAVPPPRGNHGTPIGYAHQTALSSKQFPKFPDKDIQSVVITRGYLQPQFPLGFKQQDDQTLGADDESDGGTPVSTRPTQHRRKTQHDPRKADDADPDDDDFYDGAPDQDRSNTGAPYDPSTSSDQPSSPGGNSSSTMIVWGWLVDLFLFKVRVKMKIKL